MEQKERKNVVMGMLLAAICIMAVGYAALAQQLTITGTAQITSTWDVQITGIAKQGTPSAGVTENKVKVDGTDVQYPTYTATTAQFNVSLTNPGDTITYAVTVTNGGSLAAILDSITVSATDANDAAVGIEEDAILYEVTGVTAKTTKLAANGGTNTVLVKITYNPDVTTQPAADALEKNLTVTLNYVQDI